MTTSLPLTQAKSAQHSPWRSAGIWLSAILVAYTFFNAFRAAVYPFEFAETFGTPLAEGSSTAFVMVYAIRALFVALLGSAIIFRQQWRMLTWFALIAIVMPVGDALLVASQGGEPSIVVRHVLIAAVLLVTGFLVARWNKHHEARVE